jgi:hypothetical protein
VSTLKIDGTITLLLPGYTAVRIDTAACTIAIDNAGDFDGPIEPGYEVHDLRDGRYGGFHRLLPAGQCYDLRCSAAEHIPHRGLATEVLGDFGDTSEGAAL